MMDTEVFIPAETSREVEKLQAALRLQGPAVRMIHRPEPDARERDCFAIVTELVNNNGGHMRLGWAVWQHGILFVEGEFHSVYDPGNGQPWIDVTPRSKPLSEILFLPDPTATYNLNSTDLLDNCRVALLPDRRIDRALQALTRKTEIMNSVPGVDVAIPPHLVMKMAQCEMEAAQEFDAVLRSHRTGDFSGARASRNGRCPCGGGKKYKACHGG